MSQTRARILAEATRQLTRVGYPSFTVAAVRDALGLSSGSVFYAFASKAALAAAVYVEGMSDYQRTASETIEREADPRQTIRALIAQHLAWVEDHKALARYLFGTLPDEVMELAQEPLAARNAVFFANLARLYERAEEAGLVGRVELRVAMALCIGPAQEYCRQWTRGLAPLSPREVTGLLQSGALAALATTLGAALDSDAETHADAETGKSGASASPTPKSQASKVSGRARARREDRP